MRVGKLDLLPKVSLLACVVRRCRLDDIGSSGTFRVMVLRRCRLTLVTRC